MPAGGSSLANLERTVLGNGLRVIVAPDRSSPLIGVAVVYDVGFRSEPEGRSGFAHLFEHLMFQGSANVAKIEHMRLVQSAGGVVNGHTLPDLTAYYEALPAGELELGLWLEADRMASLALSEENLRNQVSVVEEEIKVNVLNRPYGGFPWITLPALAYTTYPNAHNGYGDFAHLEDATLEDAADFRDKYYAPSNAVLVVCGDCKPDEVVELADRHFGGISRRPVPPHGPFPEPLPATELHEVIEDRLAPQAAFAVGYRTPDPVAELDAYASYAVLASVLSDGDASRLRRRLVYEDRSVTDVGCILGAFGGDTFYMRDPVLFQVVVFHPGVASTSELQVAVERELERLAADGPTAEELARVAAGFAAGHWRSIDPVLDRTGSPPSHLKRSPAPHLTCWASITPCSSCNLWEHHEPAGRGPLASAKSAGSSRGRAHRWIARHRRASAHRPARSGTPRVRRRG
jgi:predicted Zn-dependent peptidase